MNSFAVIFLFSLCRSYLEELGSYNSDEAVLYQRLNNSLTPIGEPTYVHNTGLSQASDINQPLLYSDGDGYGDIDSNTWVSLCEDEYLNYTEILIPTQITILTPKFAQLLIPTLFVSFPSSNWYVVHKLHLLDRFQVQRFLNRILLP